MGIRVSGIFIDGLPKCKPTKNTQGLNIDYKKVNNLSPKNISVAFYKKKTIILYDDFMENILTQDLDFSEFEKQILELFPNKTFFSIIIDDTINFTGFSITVKNKKYRTKGTLQGNIYADEGTLVATESQIYKNFIKTIKDNKAVNNVIEKYRTSMDEETVRKTVLKLRDGLYEKSNSENEYHYLNGTMDNAVCEDFLDHYFKMDYFDIEDKISFYQLNEKKFDLLKDFKGFISISYKNHIKKHWITSVITKFKI